MAIAAPTADVGGARSRLARTTQLAVAVAVLVAVFAYAVPGVADYGSVWAVLGTLSWPEISLLVAVTALTTAACWPPIVASLPGLTLGQAAVNNQTATAVANTVPGGGVVAIGVTCLQYRSWGFTPAGIALSVLLTGIWNCLVRLALPILAVLTLALTGSGHGALLLPALVGLAILAGTVALLGLLMHSREFARRMGGRLGAVTSWLRRLARKAPVTGWAEAAVRFRQQSTDLVGRRWLALTLTTTASHLSLYLLLLLTVRQVGISAAEVSWAEVFGIFALARLLSAAPITPGGVGVLEITYITGLVLAGGNDIRAQAVAATVLFRLLTYAAQVPLGAVTYLIWQRRTSWRRAQPGQHPGGAVAERGAPPTGAAAPFPPAAPPDSGPAEPAAVGAPAAA